MRWHEGAVQRRVVIFRRHGQRRRGSELGSVRGKWGQRRRPDVDRERRDRRNRHRGRWDDREQHGQHQLGRRGASTTASTSTASSSATSSSTASSSTASSSTASSSSSSSGTVTSGGLLWAKRYGDASSQVGQRIKTDGQGNAYVAANFGGVLDVGNGALTCTSTSGGSLLAKLSPSGTAIWSKALCSNEDLSILGLAVDAAGNSIVTGWFEGTLDFGGTSLTAVSNDVFVAKYDSAGNLLWCKRYGGGSVQNWGNDVAVAASGRIGLTGFFYGSIDFGGGPLTVSGTSHDIFVTELGPDGSFVFAKGFGTSGQNTGDGVAFDAAGNLFVTGLFEGPVDFGNGMLTISGGFDGIFLAKLDPTGKSLWSQGFSASVDNSSLEPFGVAVDGAGNVVMDGVYAGSASFGGATINSVAGGDDLFLAKWDGAGTSLSHQELRRRLQPVRYGGLAVDAAGNILLTGELYGTFDFGGGPLVDAGQYDFYLAKLDPNGNHLWSRRAGDAQYQGGYAVAADPAGNVWATGYMDGTADFGGGPLVSAGDSDLFVAKLAP